MNILKIISQAGPLGWATLAVLLTMSVVSWGVMGFKFVTFAKLRQRTARFLESFWQSRNLEKLYDAAKGLPKSAVSQVFQAGYVELVKISQSEHGDSKSETVRHNNNADKIDNVERALHRAATAEISHLESNLTFLATTGSTAPFIGLFGTVVGIMRSFHQIGLSGTANIADVAPGISEALFATACGLAAAIPAVVAYNQFHANLKRVTSELETFSADFLNIVKRNFFK